MWYRFLVSFVVFSFGIFIWWLLLQHQNTQEVIYEPYDSFTDISYFEFSSPSEVEKQTKQKYQEFLENNIVKEKELFSQNKSTVSFFPESLVDHPALVGKIQAIQTILSSSVFENHHVQVAVELYKDTYKVRGTFQNRTIKMFSVLDLSDEEFIAVFIHELWHYFDVHYFEKKVLFDLSDRFYDLSWQATRVMKAGLGRNDFVSWYAMTNKYEDFAESFIYYMVFNEDFARKSEKSEILQKKYDFFQKYLFPKNHFIATSFSQEESKEYYWDITKKIFSWENLLNYFQK